MEEGIRTWGFLTSSNEENKKLSSYKMTDLSRGIRCLMQKVTTVRCKELGKEIL